MFALSFLFDRSDRSRAKAALFLGALVLASAGCNQIFGIRLGHALADEDAGYEDGEDATGGGGAAGSTGGTAGTAGTKGDASTHDGQNDVGDASSIDGATCSKDADCATREHVRPGAPVTCAQGKCRVPDSSCVTGWVHCSTNPDEFCETDVTTPERCGTCTNACSTTLPLCRGGQCVTSCMTPTPDLCETTCVDTKSDLAHCGKCNQPCAFPNADATCSGGECKMGACKQGYGDCSDAPGCETRLNTLTNCGACNTPCGGDSGDIASCATGTCEATCVKKGPEECYNGIDDDCDGKLDCEDSDCTPTSICEPVGTAAYGTVIPASDPCPMGFNSTTGTPLYSGLTVDPLHCTGCGCSANCGVLSAAFYDSAANCTANAPLYTAQVPESVAPSKCFSLSSPTPFSVYSLSTALTTAGCKITGAPTRIAPTWDVRKKFCPAPYSAGGGCQSGSICVPKPPITACLLTSGTATCAAAHSQEKLFTGYDDPRVCTACTCTSTGNCPDFPVESTTTPSTPSGTTCGGTISALSTKKCVAVASAATLLYSSLLQPPNTFSCSVNSGVNGAVIPTGETTICCRTP